MLINASPDLRQQIEANPELWPKQGLRSSPISAVLLTNADVDAVAGLLSLREGTPFSLYAHQKVLDTLASNAIFEVVNREFVPRLPVSVGIRVSLMDVANQTLGIDIRAFAAPGKIPLYLEGEADGRLDTAAEDGDTLGLEVFCGASRLIYLANCARITADIRSIARGADAVFMDGTLWQDDEMIRMGVSHKSGKRMGHISMSGPDGAISQLADVEIGRRLFIHINNSNPVLLPDSPERAEAEALGWQIAEDGMAIKL